MQYQLVDINLSILVIYSLCFMINRDASRAYALLAFFVCCLISYTDFYNFIDAVQYHSLFAIIYIFVTYKVKSVYPKLACCLLGCFQILMAWDGWVNAQNETYIWIYYENIIYILHSLVFGAFISRDIIRIKSSLECVIAAMRKLFRNTCNMSRVWYYCTYYPLKKNY